MAFSYLNTHGGAIWVRETYDYFLYGLDRANVEENGDVRVCKGYLYDAFQSLPVLWCNNAEIAPGDIYLRKRKQPFLTSSELFDATEASCRLQRSTYAVDVLIKLQINKRAERTKLELCSLPLMVGSDVFGGGSRNTGYFVMDGMEKILVNRENRKFDTPLFKKLDGAYIVEVNSFNSPLQIRLFKKKLQVKMSWVTEEYFSFLMFVRAIGCTTPSHLLITGKHADFGDYVVFDDDENVDVDECVSKIGELFLSTAGVDEQTKLEKIRNVKETVMLPFLKPKEKVPYLLDMVSKLVEFAIYDRMKDGPDLGYESLQGPTDINSLENKCVYTAGAFMGRKFAKALMDFWKAYHNQLQLHAKKPKKNSNAFTIFMNMPKSITKNLYRLLRNNKYVMALPRRAHWKDSLSSICRVVACGVEEQSSDDKPRQTHGSYYGNFCLIQSQEGDATGMSRDIAMFARVTNEGDREVWIKALRAEECMGPYACYLNGSFVRSDVSYKAVKRLKRTVDRYASVVLIDQSVFVVITAGRVVRPVWISGKQGSYADDFELCFQQGRIEFIDSVEVRHATVAVSERELKPYHDYIELHPCALMGFSAAEIPFPEKNYAARNLFGSHVMPQATGIPLLEIPMHKGVNTHNRYDSDQKHWMFYPQRPMCTTHFGLVLGTKQAPCGFNAVVALLAMENNEEDAILISEGMVQRGCARLFTEVSVYDIESKDVRFGLPSPQIRSKSNTDWNYNKLDPADGIVHVGEVVSKNDVLVGKIRRTMMANGSIITRDQSTEVWTSKFSARVVSVCKTVTEHDETIVHIRFCWLRVPEVGDKFALRNGQKSVVAQIVSDASMPYTWDGMRPDILMNPFAFPTRRTGGQLYESVVGKTACLHPPDGFVRQGSCGTHMDCTAFSDSFDFDTVCELLGGSSFNPMGEERMFDGRTGGLMEASVFIGVVFYQRLIHFSRDKSHARGTGSYNPQTLQPRQGRKQGGGIKNSEMDGKAMCAHGAAFFLQDRFVKCSDGVVAYICNSCETSVNLVGYRCALCASTDVHEVLVPNVFLLFLNLIRAANIGTKVRVNRETSMNGSFI